jgi:hypothetical protein
MYQFNAAVVDVSYCGVGATDRIREIGADAGPVKQYDATRSSIQRKLYDGTQHRRMRVCSLSRRAIPSERGLDDDSVTL